MKSYNKLYIPPTTREIKAIPGLLGDYGKFIKDVSKKTLCVKKTSENKSGENFLT